MAIEAIYIRDLVIAPENIRRIDAPVDDLVASIAAHGLLQNLVGYRDADGKVAVTAGGRRARALLALADDKDIKAFRPTMRVPVDIREKSEALREVSLAENALRIATHPLDESQAYADIIDAGGTVAGIALRFALTERHVEGRLRLARLCPEVREAYRAGDITLEHARAFTVTDSHEVQREALAGLRNAAPWNRSPDAVRTFIAQDKVRPQDRIARFVTVEAYLAAGGGVMRDLFTQNGSDVVALTDSGLLTRLAQARLTEHATSIADRGWKWIETSIEMPGHDVLGQYERLYADDLPLSPEDADKLAGHEARADAIEAALEKGADPDTDGPLTAERRDALTAEHDRLLHEMEALESGTRGYREEDRARAGVIVCISYGGELQLVEGLVRADDADLPGATDGASDPEGDGDSAIGTTPISIPSGQTEAVAAEKAAGLSQAHVVDLGHYRQQILKAAVAADPETALDLVVHGMITQLFHRGYGLTPLSATFTQTVEHVSVDDLDTTAAGCALKALAEDLPIIGAVPDDTIALFDAVRALDHEMKLRLLAYCTAMTLSVGLSSNTSHAQRLAEHVGGILEVDVAAYWRPTEDRYFSRVRKAHLLAVLGDVGPARLAREMASAKKLELVKGVSRMFDPATRPAVLTDAQVGVLDTWLPPNMAFAPVAPVAPVAENDAGDAAGDDAVAGAENALAMVAAE